MPGDEVSTHAEGLWRGGVRKREQTQRPRVRRIFSGHEWRRAHEVLNDHGKTIYDLVYLHGMDPFQQQQQLADHREGHYEYKSGVFQQSAEEGGWGGMIVQMVLFARAGGSAATRIVFYVVFPMPEEREITEVSDSDVRRLLKPLMNRIVQRYFGAEWRAMGIRFLKDAPTADDELEIIDDQRKERKGDYLKDALWWYGDRRLLSRAAPKPPEDSVPPNTAAINDVELLLEYQNKGSLWFSFEEMKKALSVEEINQQRVMDTRGQLGYLKNRRIVIVAEPEETERLLALFS